MTNIISNPGFESGTTGWTFYTDGIGVFTADNVSPYSGTNDAKNVLTVVGTTSILYQTPLTIGATTAYRLKFAAYSSNSRDMTVRLIKHTAPFTAYMPDYIPNLSNSWTHYSIDFVSTNVAPVLDARFMFNFQTHANNGDIYYIDEISLQKISETTGNMLQCF